MSLKITSTAIEDVKVIVPQRFADARGYFSEVYNRRAFAEASGLDPDFVQDNCSYSERKGTIRGLHFQTPPFAQAKLVRALRGAIFDVAVDIRVGSPTFGRYVGCILTPQDGNQLFIPAGFAHGFCTLEDGCELAYKVTEFYAPQHDAGLFWADADVNIDWPCDRATAVLSEKDARLPPLRDLPAAFHFGR